MRALPQTLAITPHRRPVDVTLSVPGSKSITNRVLLLTALAAGESELIGALSSDDTDVMRDCLQAMGARIETEGDNWHVTGTGGRLKSPKDTLFVRNSGTTARFLTAAATLADGPVILDGNERMRERPILHLVEALRNLGAALEIRGNSGCPPVRVAGGGLPGGSAMIDGRHSSQYTSAILLSAPYADSNVELAFAEGEVVSRPYVDITLAIMREFGARAEWIDDSAGPRLAVQSGYPYQAHRYRIEPDASSAAYPFCAAAITGGTVTVEGIPEDSIQADFKLLDLLEQMGCRIMRRNNSITICGAEGGLRSIGDVDMNDLPDAVLAYSVVALFADGPTHIKNVWNLRIKETDRLNALESELRKLGAHVTAGKDSLEILPGALHGAEIETYDDHRMAMSFALAGLRIPGVVIRDPSCVSKTWPDYFDFFQRL